MAKRRGWGRQVAIGAAILIAGGGAWLFWRHDNAQTLRSREAGDARSGWRGFAAGIPGMPGSVGGPADGRGTGTDPVNRQFAETALTSWRTAILVRNSDAVLALDRAFAEHPAQFTPALIESARSDQDERVRSFSTRVLGKLKSPELATFFAQQLKDHGVYVRQNAAWALGELTARPEGRAAALHSIAELQRAAKGDPAPEVRAAAAGALNRLQ